MRLSKGEAHVWWARRADASAALQGLLDETERGRFAAYVQAADRERFVVGCALAKLVLAQYLDVDAADIRFSRTCSTCGLPHAKPRLREPATDGFELSVSHSGERVGVAVTPHAPVGVDVEQLDRSVPVDELAASVLAEDELRQLDALDPGDRQRGFLVWWTRKEAAVKAIGAGLELPLPSVVVTPPRELPQLVAWTHHVPPEQMTLFELAADDEHVASLAVLGALTAVRELDGSALLRARNLRHRRLSSARSA